MVKRTVSGAHYGVRDWLVQRFAALVMALFTPFFLVYFLAHTPLDFDAWRGLFRPLWLRLAMLLFMASLLLHAWVGVRDILMDYVHPTAVRLGLYLVTILLLAACGAWTAHILWSI